MVLAELDKRIVDTFRPKYIGHYGIDMFREPEDESAEWYSDDYEDRAFAMLNHELVGAFGLRAVGPAIINRSFRESPHIHRGEYRPDGMLFMPMYDHEQQRMRTGLAQLWESRSGVMNDPEDYRWKITRFTILLAHIRDHSVDLGAVLNTCIPKAWGLTDDIYIPRDEEISLVFVTPKAQRFVDMIRHPFRHHIIQKVLRVPKEQHQQRMAFD